MGAKNLVRWLAIFATCGSPVAQADEVDDVIAARMQERHINGLSLAIVQDGKIIKAKGYGFTDKSAQTPVTADTLFQAGSISKSVAAFGALHLVQEGRLSLDADVNTELRTWKVPENEFTKDKKVTLRGILSHSAGLTVHGFPGYPADGPIPALVEVLDGVKPANTPAIVEILRRRLYGDAANDN
jgi:CubicO group peptidase (beta-lactamase class C family)